MSQPDGHIHVVPTDDFQEHEESAQCWCQPVRIERTIDGAEVWSHNRAKCAVS